MNSNRSSAPAYEILWPAKLRDTAPIQPWLWTGYIAPGNLTLLTSPWKAGKTTLTSLLLARLAAGGELAGQEVRPGTAVVVSEEAPAQWRRRADRLNYREQVCFICRPFATRPTAEEWQHLIDHVRKLHAEHGLSMAIFDPLAEFLPAKSENEAGLMLEALLPLRRLTTAGLAVLLLHHPRKQTSAEGESARGSGALSGHADILMELSYFSTASSDDRRRKLVAVSRFEETPRQVVIELNAAGTDYVSRGDVACEEFGRGWGQLREVLAATPQKRSRPELLEDWPEDRWPRPSAATLGRWLTRAVAEGRVLCEGSGRKQDGFRYWLAEEHDD
jgi:hypothetical protein